MKGMSKTWTQNMTWSSSETRQIYYYFTDFVVGNLLDCFTGRSLIYNKGHKGTQRKQPEMDVNDLDT